MTLFDDNDIIHAKKAIDEHHNWLLKHRVGVWFEGKQVFYKDILFYDASVARRWFTEYFCDSMIKNLMPQKTQAKFESFKRKDQLKFWHEYVKFLEQKGILEFK